MVAIDTWQEQGFGAIAKEYLPRLPTEKGVRRDIDENGDLLVRRMGKTDVARRSCCRPCCSRPGTIRRREARAREAASHHPARSVRYVRVRARRRARRMGGDAAPSCSRTPIPGGLQGKERTRFSRRLSRRDVARLVDTGADRGGERRRPRGLIDELARRLVEHSARPILLPPAPPPKRRSRFAASLCNQPQDTLIAVHRSFENGEIREAFRTPARAKADRSRCAPSRSWKWKTRSSSRRIRSTLSVSRRETGNEGFLAVLRPSSARP